jgi:hypothetical protein
MWHRLLFFCEGREKDVIYYTTLYDNYLPKRESITMVSFELTTPQKS